MQPETTSSLSHVLLIGLAMLSVSAGAYSVWLLRKDRRVPKLAGSSSAHTGSSESSIVRGFGPSLRYLDEFVSDLTCSSHLLEIQMYPDAKEITESMAM